MIRRAIVHPISMTRMRALAWLICLLWLLPSTAFSDFTATLAADLGGEDISAVAAGRDVYVAQGTTMRVFDPDSGTMTSSVEVPGDISAIALSDTHGFTSMASAGSILAFPLQDPEDTHTFSLENIEPQYLFF